MANNDNLKYIVQILTRAEDMGISVGERIDRLMDIENANNAFNLDLKALAEADDLNFVHDYCGIVDNIDRSQPAGKKFTSENFNFFVPRFAQKNSVNETPIKKESITKSISNTKTTNPVNKNKQVSR